MQAIKEKASRDLYPVIIFVLTRWVELGGEEDVTGSRKTRGTADRARSGMQVQSAIILPVGKQQGRSRWTTMGRGASTVAARYEQEWSLSVRSVAELPRQCDPEHCILLTSIFRAAYAVAWPTSSLAVAPAGQSRRQSQDGNNKQTYRPSPTGCVSSLSTDALAKEPVQAAPREGQGRRCEPVVWE
jgi:hypothetical protein